MNQQDYNATMQLPKTDFPMRAGLPKSEPERLKAWEDSRLYHLIMEKNEGRPLYVLHDGPPYANGDIHIGHALNKILKDFIVRYRNLAGYKAPYVPGWDTHGLPIELKAREKAGVANAVEMSPVELRAICKDFALGYVNNQREQFKRLGVLGEWERPYLTLLPEFEARQIEIFGEMADKGYIYKGLKPVYWCPECQTALAEAEIEYAEDACVSIYVKFRVTEDNGVLSDAGIDPSRCHFVIWTTTTWTLPANVAICLNADFTYQVLKAGDEYYIMAEELAGAAMEQAGLTDYEVVASFTGAQLERIWTQHPFLPERKSLVIVGDHVTLESGTGCVHTAPGHGVEDFNVCKNYPELPIVVPVDKEGRMTEEAGPLCAGMTTNAANKVLLAELEQSGALFAHQKITHQYPHCWRCHKPVLFRATEQWFCSVDSFKDEAVKAIEGVRWIPAWGEDRITSMVRERADWCISRQRLWGVPIPAFYCEDCDKAILDKTFIQNVAKFVEKEGSDAWYLHSAEELLPEGARCPHCGGTHFRKETDIMDVWFDSGTSHASVLDGNWKDQRWPADLYLEGADQYRGWFQSSLLTAVASRGESPYKAVLTHGWTVDGEGKKMSKSLGNGIEPKQVIDQYGADILRLWVSSLDYKVDARLSQEILKQQSEAYRKIRNTARFILGNLSDFDPNTQMTADADLENIDRFMRIRLDELTAEVCKAYDNYAFYEAMHKIHNFCVVDLSNFYLDVIKDRLYVEAADSATRRSAQSTIYWILSVLTRLLAPILAYTSEEIWSYLPHMAADDARSVMLNDIPTQATIEKDDAFTELWKTLLSVRNDVQKALETARNDKLIGSSLEAKVTLFCKEELLNTLNNAGTDLAALFIVSQVELMPESSDGVAGETEGLTVSVAHADGEKCARCWMYSETVGKHDAHKDLCARCASILD